MSLRSKYLRGNGSDYPLFWRFVREDTATPLTEAIITEKPYPIKALIIEACNPILTWPNTNKVKKAFEKLDLMVVVDLFMTNTPEVQDFRRDRVMFLLAKHPHACLLLTIRLHLSSPG